MKSINSIVNLSEAQEESRRLTKVTGRDVEVRTDMCCDFDKTCGTCGGQGYVYVLVYRCGHIVPDGADLECESQDCEHKSYLASIEREEELEASHV